MKGNNDQSLRLDSVLPSSLIQNSISGPLQPFASQRGRERVAKSQGEMYTPSVVEVDHGDLRRDTRHLELGREPYWIGMTTTSGSVRFSRNLLLDTMRKTAAAL
jgi:hypothetical protein